MTCGRLLPCPADAACDAIVEQVMELVEAEREANGLRSSDLAERAQVSRRTVDNARNLRRKPTLRNLLALCHATGLRLDIRVVRPRSLEGASLTADSGPPSSSLPRVRGKQ